MMRLLSLRGSTTATLVVVVLAIFTDLLLYGMVVPILPGYATSLGVSEAGIGLLFGSYGAALLLATPFFGLLSDRIGRRRPLVGGLFGLTLSTLVFMGAEQFSILVFARVCQGIAGAATWTAGLALLADTAPPARRGALMGMAMTGAAAGTLVGPAFGGFLFEWGGYSLPFLVAALITFVAGIAGMLLLVEPVRRAANGTTMMTFLRDRQILVICGIVALGSGVTTLIEPVLPLHLEQHLNATPGMIGLLFGVLALSYGLMSSPAGALSDRWGRLPIMIGGLIATALVLPLVALPSSLLLAGTALFALGAAIGCVLAPTMSALADAVDGYGGTAYGAAYAIFNCAYAFGMMSGPITGGVLVSMVSLLSTLMIVSAFVVSYVALLLLATRKWFPAPDIAPSTSDTTPLS